MLALTLLHQPHMRLGHDPSWQFLGYSPEGQACHSVYLGDVVTQLDGLHFCIWVERAYQSSLMRNT